MRTGEFGDDGETTARSEGERNGRPSGGVQVPLARLREAGVSAIVGVCRTLGGIAETPSRPGLARVPSRTGNRQAAIPGVHPDRAGGPPLDGRERHSLERGYRCPSPSRERGRVPRSTPIGRTEASVRHSPEKRTCFGSPPPSPRHRGLAPGAAPRPACPERSRRGRPRPFNPLRLRVGSGSGPSPGFRDVRRRRQEPDRGPRVPLRRVAPAHGYGRSPRGGRAVSGRKLEAGG